ncbi:MAG: GIY-YIG nuclease family protein [Pseudomonadota bacterium]|nr:GIY-YIG nuclease family protein [Pseudomonadota bacterium]MEC8889979.1 GIY-YIG nuclease family protein [Pseudomonadota bacterium]MEE3293415.1 GIY-YIG nuclease family protein [Pseudomonadota bacterium]
MPSSAGTYAIVMRAQDRQQLQIGRLGGVQLSKGWYVYVGSAFGPGGLAARVSRHLRCHKTRHWHIDHLIWATTVREVWYSQRQRDLEHCWAQAALDQPAAQNLLRGFGASDCQCLSHLVRFPTREAVKTLFNALEAKVWIPQL